MSARLTEHFSGRIRAAYLESVSRVVDYRSSISRLKSELNEFPSRLRQAALTNEFLDIALANILHQRCGELIVFCERNLPKEDTRYILAAVDYFTNHLDGSPDFSALDGFADDAIVVNAVITDFSIKLPTIQVNGSKESA